MKTVSFQFFSVAQQSWTCEEDSFLVSFGCGGGGLQNAIFSDAAELTWNDFTNAPVNGREDRFVVMANQYIPFRFQLNKGQTYFIFPGSTGTVQLILGDPSVDF